MKSTRATGPLAKIASPRLSPVSADHHFDPSQDDLNPLSIAKVNIATNGISVLAARPKEKNILEVLKTNSVRIAG